MKQVMYIGPDIERLVTKNQIFTYWPDELIRRAKEIEPLAEKLFVRLDDIVEKKRELERNGSLLNTVYKRLSRLI